MGLDARIMIEVQWPIDVDRPPLPNHPHKDEFPMCVGQYHIADLNQHHYVHGFLMRFAEKSINEDEDKCNSISYVLHKSVLKQLAEVLNAWSTNRTALAPCPNEWWEPCFGLRPGRKGFLKERDRLRRAAKGLSKQIRKARRYVRRKNEKYKHVKNGPSFLVVYEACW